MAKKGPQASAAPPPLPVPPPNSQSLLFFLQPRVRPDPKTFGMGWQWGCWWEEVSPEPPRTAVTDPSKIRANGMPHLLR